MTSALVVASPAAQGGQPGTGRNVAVEGNRYAARFTITLPNPWVGAGVGFDPVKYGLPTKPSAFESDPHSVIAGRGRYQLTYDFTNKNLCIWDTTDSDNADGDDLSTYIFDVVFRSE